MRIREMFVGAGAAVAVALVLAPAAQAGVCRDPWITQAVREVTGREPNGDWESGECTYTQYGGGRWHSYPELKGYVQQKLQPTFSIGPQPGGNVHYRTVNVPNGVYAGLQKRRLLNGSTEVLYQGAWWRLVGPDGGTMKLIGNDAGS